MRNDLQYELSAQTAISHLRFQDNLGTLKDSALNISQEYEGNIRIEITTNPEKSIAKVNVIEYNL